MESNTSRLLNTQSLWQSYRNAVEQRSASALSSSLLKHEDVESGLLHAKQMEFVHKQYDKQIDYEKIEKMGALSIGEYDFKTNKVKVVTLKACANLLYRKFHEM